MARSHRIIASLVLAAGLVAAPCSAAGPQVRVTTTKTVTVTSVSTRAVQGANGFVVRRDVSQDTRAEKTIQVSDAYGSRGRRIVETDSRDVSSVRGEINGTRFSDVSRNRSGSVRVDTFRTPR